MSTKYLTSGLVRIKKKAMPEGENVIVVKQMGSSDTVFRTSNEYRYERLPETEAESEAESTKEP